MIGYFSILPTQLQPTHNLSDTTKTTSTGACLYYYASPLTPTIMAVQPPLGSTLTAITSPGTLNVTGTRLSALRVTTASPLTHPPAVSPH